MVKRMWRCCRTRAGRRTTWRIWSNTTTECSGTGHLYDRWPVVVQLSHRVELKWFRQVAPVSVLGERGFGVSRIGTIAAARVALSSAPSEAFIAVSL